MNKHNLLTWTENAVNWLAGMPVTLIVSAISFIGLFIGLLFILKPASAIEIQRIIYAQLNWKIEPISLPRELRNLRWLGLVLVVFLCVVLFVVLFTDLFSP